MRDYRSLFRDALVISASVGEGRYRLMAGEGDRPDEYPLPNIWLRITPDNLITVFIGKSEMGQGVSTSLPMIVAEELDADWGHVRFEMSPAGEEYRDPVWDSQTTGGSASVRHLYEPLRRAGAAAREMLVRAASELWGISARECGTSKGMVLNQRTGENITYGDLCLRAAGLPVPKKPHLKQREGGLAGSPVQRLDVVGKVQGTAVFGMDIFVPGMLYGVLARPPYFGSKALSFDREAAGRIPGVRRIVRVAEGIGVCAESVDAAWRGRDALNVNWDKGSHPGLNDSFIKETFVRQLKEKGHIARDEAKTTRIFDRVSKKVEATYFLPYLAHAPMEPMNCTAHAAGDRCDIWAPTQNQSGLIQAAAELTGLKPGQIRVHTTCLGGGLGRRLENDYALEAVNLSMEAGRPVKLLWGREEDMRNDFYRPGCCARMAGTLDGKGRFFMWSQKVVVPSIFSRVSPGRVEDGIDPAAVEGLTDSEYEVPRIRTEYVRIDLPVPVGLWRSVGHSCNAFIVESFVDEMAAAAGKDPLEFRLDLLQDHPRASGVLRLAAEKAGWGKKRDAGTGLGIAQHFSYGSYVAQAAEVSVDEKTGDIRVGRVVCAVDCGPVINPAIVTAQVTGGIIFGLSAAMEEAVRFDSGGVSSANFNDYRMLRMKDAPEIELHIVQSSAGIGGIGEVGVPPVAPAVANAIFNATGIRIRRLPIVPAFRSKQEGKE